MDPVRLGIAGCGVMSGSHLDLAKESPLAEVVAVADICKERARAAAEKHNIPAYYAGEDELLNDKCVDAVILALPTGVRTPVAYKALEHGKHVLLEKPVASRAEEVDKMMELREDRVVACCSSRYAFTPHAEAAAKCVASGVLGKTRLVRMRVVEPADAVPDNNPPPWRQSMQQNGGGILVNWGCYDLNYMMHVMGWQVKPKTVLAQWWPVVDKMSAYVAAGSDADSHFNAFIRCEDDIVLCMERAEFSSARSDEAWQVIGTDASLHLTMNPRKAESAAVILDKFVPGEGVVSETVWDGSQGGAADNVVNDFVAAIAKGCPPQTGLEQALVMQKITDAIYASGKSGQAVAL